jgi:hypothetical protein
MLGLSLGTSLIAAIALYISSKINDDVFKTGMKFTSLTFTVVTLFCAPWLLKLFVASMPLILGSLNSWSTENFN